MVANGKHGTQEAIQNLKCQACGVRRDTILYRLKTHSGLVEKIVWLLASGVDASTLEEVFGLREITIRTWLCRSGMQCRKLHERFLVELELVMCSWMNYGLGKRKERQPKSEAERKTTAQKVSGKNSGDDGWADREMLDSKGSAKLSLTVILLEKGGE